MAAFWMTIPVPPQGVLGGPWRPFEAGVAWSSQLGVLLTAWGRASAVTQSRRHRGRMCQCDIVARALG